MTDTSNDRTKSSEVFARHYDMRQRGHDTFCKKAEYWDRMYRGGGEQWPDYARSILELSGRPVREINDIMSAVNAAVGYQINNRLDVAFLPRGGERDAVGAKVFSKYIKHTMDNTNYRDHETDAYIDGLVQGRGFLDIRMEYGENSKGEVKIITLDPMDVAIDPDARDYDPDTWSDVCISRWMTAREIGGLYGDSAMRQAKEHGKCYGFEHEYIYDMREHGNSFGASDQTPYYGINKSIKTVGALVRYLVVERQSFETKLSLVAEYPTGDVRLIEDMPPDRIADLIRQGVFISKQRIRRVRIETAVPGGMIDDRITLYEHFTPVLYTPYFRRGKTLGMVANACSPQEMTNKLLSQVEHIVNATANAGWDVEEGQLVNMQPEELERRGHETGLVVVRKVGSAPLAKLRPSEVPRGFFDILNYVAGGIQRVTGVNESLLGNGTQDMSGVAIQSRQFAAQQQLAIPLWRLSQTRRLVAKRVQELVQRFMHDERMARITEIDEYGVEQQVQVKMNAVNEDGSVENDLTAGEYDMVVTEVPIHVTFDNSQFEQVKDLKELGVMIPDSVMIRLSSISDKQEIAKAVQENAPPPDPYLVAKAEREKATAARELASADLQRANAVNKNAEAMFSSARIGQLVRADPGVSEIADSIYRSAGGTDADMAPVIPTPEAFVGAEPPPVSSNPLTPDNPGAGLDAGLTSIQPPATEIPPQ